MVTYLRRSVDFPLGSVVRLADLSRDPYPIYRQLMAQEPVSWVEEQQMWYITRRQDNLDVIYDTETFTVASTESLLDDTLGTTMISTDGEAQRRLRQPFMPPFLPKAVRQNATRMIEAKANALIDRFVAAGEVELVSAFSDPLASSIVTGVLGLPLEDFAQFRGWYDDIAAALANFIKDAEVRRRGKAAVAAFGEYILGHVARLKTARDHSVLSSLIYDVPHDLSNEEIVSSVILIIFGGLETTAAMFSNTVWALLRHPDQLAEVRADDGLLTNALEEALRWESPVQTATRQATRDTQIAGVQIQKGEVVQCILGAANRDPAHFAEPDLFDIHRPNADDHLAFAIGRHYCLGAALARLEGQIGLRLLFERLPGLRFDPQRPSAPEGHEFRSPKALCLQWG